MAKNIMLLLLIPYITACLPSNKVFVPGVENRRGVREGIVEETADPDSRVTRTSLRVMTFNILWQGYSNGNYFDSGFVQRKPLVLDVLQQFNTDIIGLQEASIEQRAEIAPELPGYGMFPLPTEAGDECILYRYGRFFLEDSGHDYLRRVPEVPGTNIGVRDFVWVYLHDLFSGKRFYVLNLHLDHRLSNRGRQLDGVLIGEWIRNREFADPVILTGDFNGTPDKPRYLYLTGQNTYPGENGLPVRMPMPMMDTFRAANPNEKYAGTTNFDYIGAMNSNQIDYIFVPRHSTVIGSGIIYYQVNGFYPSDHFPLISEFELE